MGNENNQNVLTVYTDGGCSPNPGFGGWGVIIINEAGEKKCYSGGEEKTTNNRMELMAVREALLLLKNSPEYQGKSVTFFIDSQYVRSGITMWIENWKARNWRTSDKTPVKNKDLWVELDALNSELNITWNWVRGHSGVQYNEECDALCKKEIENQVKKSAELYSNENK